MSHRSRVQVQTTGALNRTTTAKTSSCGRLPGPSSASNTITIRDHQNGLRSAGPSIRPSYETITQRYSSQSPGPRRFMLDALCNAMLERRCSVARPRDRRQTRRWLPLLLHQKALHRGRRRRNLPLQTRRKCVVPLGQSFLNHAEFCEAAWLLSAQQTDDVRSRHRFRLHKLANFSPPLQCPALATWRWPRCQALLLGPVF